jgi:predicted nucleic acid-binding protein
MIHVVDASVAVKWFVRETFYDRAVALRDSTDELHAPDWIVIEVAHAALRKWRNREITPEQVRLMVRALPIRMAHLHRAVNLVERALAIAMTIDHPVHDCIYLACAEASSCAVITADNELLAALKGTAFEGLARHLADL